MFSYANHCDHRARAQSNSRHPNTIRRLLCYTWHTLAGTACLAALKNETAERAAWHPLPIGGQAAARAVVAANYLAALSTRAAAIGARRTIAEAGAGRLETSARKLGDAQSRDDADER